MKNQEFKQIDSGFTKTNVYKLLITFFIVVPIGLTVSAWLLIHKYCVDDYSKAFALLISTLGLVFCAAKMIDIYDKNRNKYLYNKLYRTVDEVLAVYNSSFLLSNFVILNEFNEARPFIAASSEGYKIVIDHKNESFIQVFHNNAELHTKHDHRYLKLLSMINHLGAELCELPNY